MYDLIGDIHGHADELERLLAKLGYERSGGIYRHPDRRIIFLGDFIDRGPKIREVLEIVRPMVEAGSALAVMGNHELNALAYHTEDWESPGKFLRRHTESSIRQHAKTIEQLSSGELASHLTWFRSLPMWIDLDGLRVIHACWDERSMAAIQDGLNRYQGLTDEFLFSATRPGQPLYDSVEIVLKGKEMLLPDGMFFHDKDGHQRTSARVRWYLPTKGHTFRSYSLTDEIDCDNEIDASLLSDAVPYSADAKPVFIGHYWLNHSQPELLASNVACLDFSVAKGGLLCAYRWNGEQSLTNNHFVWVVSGATASHLHAGSAAALPRNR